MKFFDRRRLVNGLLILSLLLNLAIFGYLARSGGLRRMFIKMDLAEPLKSREDFQKELEATYRKYPNTNAEVIFAGDSLVGGGPWAEFYSEVHNRGIGGESTLGFLGRLDEITESKPVQVLLLIGTNDLAAAVPEAQVLRNYRTILERLSKESPKTVVTVIGLLPVNSTLPKPTQTNAEILSVNRQLKTLVGEFPGVRYLDLTSSLADDSGNLRRDFTADGIHLNLDGYLAIRKPIQEALAR
jgi:lysophospholipase L1-like esterase